MPTQKNIAVLVFPQVEELDFVGPLEVFSNAADFLPGSERPRILTVARTDQPVVCCGGLKILPTVSFSDVLSTDVLVVPGGPGARKAHADDPEISWLQKRLRTSATIMSVCTGAFLLATAGLPPGTTVTTHHLRREEFLKRFPEQGLRLAPVGKRFVKSKGLYFAAGVTSGIDLALWLVQRIYGRMLRMQVEKVLEWKLSRKSYKW